MDFCFFFLKLGGGREGGREGGKFNFEILGSVSR
jgi:hypothetical protein